jgi:anthranilate phosphoribosyltransferase
LQELLRELAAGHALSFEQAQEAFDTVMRGEASDAQTAALLSLIAARGVTEDELVGAALARRAHAETAPVPEGLGVVDTCGTGGDGSGTFNISTAAALVAGAAGRGQGMAVAKHGNRSFTSGSGSSDVLEALGVRIEGTGPSAHEALAEAGVCFCFAPAHHPAMKHAAPVRRELGFRTIFNLLGPLTNPAGARRQVMGVYEARWVAPIARVLQRLGAERALVGHGETPDGGIDELSTGGESRLGEVSDGAVRERRIDAQELGLARARLAELRAGGPEESAAAIRTVLCGESAPARDIVLLNAAAALVVGGVAADLAEGLNRAAQAVDRGEAQRTLERLVRVTG